MTDTKALAIALGKTRKKVKEAMKRVGDNPEAVLAELQREAAKDTDLMKAITLVGHAVVQSQEETRH